MALCAGATSPAQHQTVFIDRDDYQNEIYPPDYWGASAQELIGNGRFNVNDPVVDPVNITWADGDGDGFGDVPSNVSWELKEHFLLNQLVEDLNADPIALAGYVQNEISLTSGFQFGPESPSSVFDSARISRGAYSVLLERQGSPWEQSALLVYLLRRAGYPAAIVETSEFAMLMRLDRLDRVLGLRLSETALPDSTANVDYPWVVVNDAKDGSGTWRHVFPWLKDVIIEEGFDPYDFLPTAYNTSEKWIESYLQNDPIILGLVGPDGKDAPGELFPRHVSEHIADDSLSLEDMGYRFYNRKLQYNEWSDFPRPFWVASLTAGSEGDPVSLIVKENDLIPDEIARIAGMRLTVLDEFNRIFLQTQFMPLAQLTNRPFYFYRDGATEMGFRLGQLDPRGAPLALGNFSANDIPGPQLQTQIDLGLRMSLQVEIFDAYPNPGGDLVETLSLPAKGVTAINVNTGFVSDQMIDLLIRDFDDLQASGTASENEILGQVAYLTGQQYWKNAGEDDRELLRLHRAYNAGSFGICLSSLIDEGSGFAEIPVVDIPVAGQIYVNGTIHPDDPSVPDDILGRSQISLMAAANYSAHEHQVINQFYGIDNAISTVKLLQISNRDFATGSGLNPNGYYEFTRSEFDAANTDPQYAGLRSDAGTLWQSARNRLVLDGTGYTAAGWERVYTTPFPIESDVQAGETPSFDGMGVLVTSRTGFGAFIQDGAFNGGHGPFLPGDPFAPANITEIEITFDENGDPTFDGDGTRGHPTTDTTPDPQAELERQQANERNGETPTTPEEALQNTQDRGDIGLAENNDASDDVGDPVDPVTGKFTMDQVDLTLEGPFPLQLRRNYSSLNPAHNLLGYGWKLNFMPYINVRADDSALFVADLDGTVVQYNLVPASSPLRWEASTEATDNPYLDNFSGGSIGGQSNRYAAYVEKTTESSDTVYTLYKPNGHEARYVVRSYPIDLGAGTVQRTRPYLDVWEDAFGNTMTFTYYETASQPEYGQLRRIQSSNGNFLGFLYNREREITETFTNDGRRVYYRYDTQGDLREVTLPDNAVIRYDYKYLTDSSGAPYSTHLIERITRPDGRVLENTYDPAYDPETPAGSDVNLRRVVSQQATVGDTLELVENAVYEYFEAGDPAVTEPLAQPWTQAGFDVTLIHSDVRAEFGRLTTIYVHEDGLKRFIADPLAPATFAPGNTDLDYVLTYEYYAQGEANGFPRSLKRMRNKRGLEMLYEYDALGNPSKTTRRGDITGDGVSEDVSTFFFYDPVNFLPTKTIYPAETTGGTNRVIINQYPDTGSAKRADDVSHPGFELYRFLPSAATTYEVVSAPIDLSTPNFDDEQATITFLYGHEEDSGAGLSAFGLLKSTRHQGADDPDDKSRTDFTHNARGFVTGSTQFTFSTDADVTTAFQYTVRGELEQSTDSAGRIVRYDYDMLGRLTHTEKFTAASDDLPTWWTYHHYNLNGETTWTDGPRYGVEDYVFNDYDGAGRLLAKVVWRSEAQPDGSGVRTVDGQNEFLGQAITYYDYDAFGNLTSTIDPRGNETTFTYDELGRLETTTYPTVETLTAEESFTYEPGGLVATATNALTGITTNIYTDHGSLKQSDAPAIDGRTESWTYYLDGRAHTHTRSNGALTTWTYDDQNRSTTMETRKDGTLLEKTVTYIDTRGNQIQKDVFYESGFAYTFTRTFDGLSRMLQSSGPPEVQRASPLETASALQQTDYSYVYASTGDRYTVTATTSGEQSIEVFDGIGRPERSEKRDSSNNLHYQENYIYDDAHLFVTTRYGSDEADDRVKTTATNTFGQNIFTLFADNTYTRRVYDKAGNLIESYDEETLTDGSPRFAYTYDERNRRTTETKLDGSITTFEYDAANHQILREMPGGITHHQSYDAALRMTGEFLEGSDSSVSRAVAYNYYPSGELIGLLENRIENTGTADQITHSYFYDDLLRLSQYSCDGTNYVGFTHQYEYDLRSLTTAITRAPLALGTGQLATRIEHELDGYGQILEERVLTGSGTVTDFVAEDLHSHIRQSWDGLGRRSQLGLGSEIAPLGSTAPDFDYSFYANHRIASIAPNAVSDSWEVQYDYEDNNLLSERRFRVNDSYNARQTRSLNRRLNDTTPYRDERGRMLRCEQTANGQPVLDETLAWSNDSRLGNYSLIRGAGTGSSWADFSDNRSHTYDPDNRRLDTESFAPSPTESSRTFDYDFDSDDLGVRVKADLDNPANTAWEVPGPDTTGLDAFRRVVTETAQPEERSFTISGTTTGPGIFELYLGEGASPISYEFLQTIDPDVDLGNGNWSVPLKLAAGQYTLEARATHLHPDSNYQATDSSTFTVSAPDPASISTTYDAHGRVNTRSWNSGDIVQSFTWDAKGNLLEIAQTDSGATETVGTYVWTAQYDGLGRRFQTDFAPAGATAITIAQNRIKCWFDPQVEFMPAAIEHHGQRVWLIHGPDMDTFYGSFEGLGGLEALVDEATGKTTPIVDSVHGHVLATIDLGTTTSAADDVIVFKEEQFGAYGPMPGTQQKPLEITRDLTESLGWQTRCIDPTGFFAMGARHYDPLSGRFLSADPLGHGATPDLYSYAGGDPINFFDPTGRRLKEGDPIGKEEKRFWGYFFDEVKELNEMQKAASRALTSSLSNFLMDEAPRMVGDAMHVAVGDVLHEGYSDTYKDLTDPDRPTVNYFGIDMDAEVLAIPVTETVEAYNAGYDTGTAVVEGDYDEAKAIAVIALIELLDRRTPGEVDAVKYVKDARGKSNNITVKTQKEAEAILNEARPEIPWQQTYGPKQKVGKEIHPVDGSGNAPGHSKELPHIKWRDWSAGKTEGAEGHIYFESVDGNF